MLLHCAFYQDMNINENIKSFEGGGSGVVEREGGCWSDSAEIYNGVCDFDGTSKRVL